jgi:hypothetical protein
VSDVVGRVAGLWRYPVKSMAAEVVEAVDVWWHGLVGDRRWGFVQERLVRSDFPWLTIRENAEMRHYVPSFEDPEDPEGSRTVVEAPDGERYDVVDPALAERLGGGVRVVKTFRGTFDVMPLSLITTQSIGGIGEALGGVELEVQRFRPNILVEARGTFPEEAWVGRVLRIGERMRMRVDLRDKRCVMVNVDPGGAARDPRVLKTIARERDARLGVYGSTVTPGRVAVGDDVVLEDAA